MPLPSRLVSIAALAIASLAGAFAQPSTVYDLVIFGGRVLDPASGLDTVRNVGITAGRIADISTSSLHGRTTVDARGLAVARRRHDVARTRAGNGRRRALV